MYSKFLVIVFRMISRRTQFDKTILMSRSISHLLYWDRFTLAQQLLKYHLVSSVIVKEIILGVLGSRKMGLFLLLFWDILRPNESP